MNFNQTLPSYEIWIEANTLNGTTAAQTVEDDMTMKFYARALTLADVANILRQINARDIGYSKIRVVTVYDIDTVMKFA